MERKNKCKKLGFSTILCAVAAILLSAVPCAWAITFDDGLEHDISDKVENDSVNVKNATVNILPGADIDWFVTTTESSVVNITGGTVGFWIDVAIGAEVTVFGTYFKLNETQYYAGDELFIRYLQDSPLTVMYDNGTQVDLSFDCHFETGGDNATVTLAAPGGPMLIDIDIKPGSYPNSINLGSNGVIPVAILSTADFDATLIPADTVFLAGSGVAVRGKGDKTLAHEEDVNEDTFVDLVVKVETENLDPGTFQDGEALLLVHESSDPVSPVLYEGWDEITIVPPE